MKHTITSLTLIAAALLPASAYAGAETMSGKRGSHCLTDIKTVMIVDMNKQADAMEEAVNAMVRSTDDPVLASYYRDLYRAPTSFKTVQFVRAPDPIVDAIAIALYGSAQPGSRLVC